MKVRLLLVQIPLDRHIGSVMKEKNTFTGQLYMPSNTTTTIQVNILVHNTYLT